MRRRWRATPWLRLAHDWLRRARVWLLRACLGFALLSALWVFAYRFIDPPGTWLMASERARLGDLQQQWTPIDQISMATRLAVLNAEDARFCGHWGFDLESIAGVIRRYQSGARLRGASTISQQTAKNLFLWPARSWLRKGLEVWFTMLIEALWPKRRILEMYLNIAEFGDGVFGVEAAAQRSFGVSARQLSIGKAARLMVTLPSPRRRDPGNLSGELMLAAFAIADRASSREALDAARCVRLRSDVE